MKGRPIRVRSLVNAALAIMIAVLYFAVTIPEAKSAISELYNSPYYRGHKKGHVAIACAVSWDAAALTDMLNVFKDMDIHITFLLSGDFVKNNSGLAKKIAEEGHEIGTMGQNPLKDGDTAFLFGDMEQAIALTQATCGVKPTLYYSGTRDVRNSSKAASGLDLVHMLCTVDVLSGRGTAEDILTRALEKPFDGSIILLEPTGQMLKALPACLNGLMDFGFQVTSVSNVL